MTDRALNQSKRPRGHTTRAILAGAGDAGAPRRTCVFCGRRNSTGARFCRRCGSRMSTAWSPPPPPPPPPSPRDSTPLVLAAGLLALLVLGVIGVAWALYDPWGGAALRGGTDATAPPAAVLATSPAVTAAPAAARPAHSAPSGRRPSAPTQARRAEASLRRSAFPEYGVTLFSPRGWRELAASLVEEEVPYLGGSTSQDQDVLAAYVPPTGEGAVVVSADRSAEPELSRFELTLDGDVVLRELEGMGLPEMRLHGETIAGRQALVSDVVSTPEMAMVAVVIVGRDRLYYFAVVAENQGDLEKVRRDYWPALQHAEFRVASQ